MLDKKSLKTLTKLNKLCNNSYKVFEMAELEAIFGKKGDTLINHINYFKEHKFIDVKYDDENVFCMCVLPKAFEEIESSENNNVINNKLKKIMFLTCLLSAMSAFLGSFVAMLIIN